MRHCYWFYKGMCPDLAPALVWIQSPIFALLLCALLWGLLKAVRHRPRTWELILLGGVGLACAGAAFTFYEARRTNLIEAASHGDEAGVKHWLSLGASPNALVYRNGGTALFKAVEAKSLPAARALLEAGANPNPDNNCTYDSPIFAAYRSSQRDLIVLLRAKGSSDPCPALQRTLVLKYGVEPSEFRGWKIPPPSADTLKALAKVSIYNVVVDNLKKQAFLQLQNAVEPDTLGLASAELAFNGKAALEILDLSLAPTEVKTLPIEYGRIEEACKQKSGRCLVEMTSHSFPVWHPFTIDATEGGERRQAIHAFTLCLKDWLLDRNRPSYVDLINFSEEEVVVTELAIAISPLENYNPNFAVPGRHVFPPKKLVRLDIAKASLPEWLEGQLDRAREKPLALKVLCAKWGPNICATGPNVLQPGERCSWIQ